MVCLPRRSSSYSDRLVRNVRGLWLVPGDAAVLWCRVLSGWPQRALGLFPALCLIKGKFTWNSKCAGN